MLRRLPVFGDVRRRPLPLAADLRRRPGRAGGRAGRRPENTVVNAIGPETFTYRELVATIGRLIGKPRPIVSVPPWLGYAGTRLLGKLLGDVMVTREEIRGLMAGLLCVDAPPAGQTRLTDWVRRHADSLGRRYASELARRKDRSAAYGPEVRS